MSVVEVSTKLVAEATGAALATSGIPGANVVEPLLRALLQVQDEQAETLQRIDANVQRLIDGPWETARTYIEEASLPVVTPEQREDKLRNASAELHRAVALQPEGSLQRAFACLHLALVERLLGDIASSTLSARRAVEAATTCMVEDLTAIKKSKPSAVKKVAMIGAGGAVLAVRSSHRTKALGRGFAGDWQQYKEIQAAANALCGAYDESVRACDEKLDEAVAKLKLSKMVTKLTAPA